MGLFSKSTQVKKLSWTELTSINELNDIISNDSTEALIFKHSTRCSISAMALRAFENEWDDSRESPKLYFLDLLKHRDVSNEIAQRLHVTHQSPQVIVFKGKDVLYHASHEGINVRKIEQTLKHLK